MTTREALIEALRFGPMAQFMRGGWEESQRLLVVQAVADDLLRDGWTRDPSQRTSHSNGDANA